ncbi:phosphatase 2C-like domain-containing protein [Lasiosphaeris hirsuta]|uniref:Phosphatase 2C-like domain-containing protein n=1 Tax=Lasiosphaeris hirsuta TaxID=260670 RepID=A0AA40DJE0_9PEZI|nr:phosphatase 2C-like domain-containing protein [Lasiosphaeris hirsuta]
MGYIVTLLPHGRHEPRIRGLAMSGFRAYRAAAGRRHLRPQIRPAPAPLMFTSPALQRNYHNYFVTHLPSSSLHPDSRSPSGLHHKLPRSASTPHTPGPGASPAVVPPNMPSRDLTVVRIPLRSAKHHFGVANSRGQREYNEDANQAGTICMPAFARRAPISLVRSQMSKSGEGTSAKSVLGDPQLFYFGVFDGHGGSECSEFLREELHGYIEEAAAEFQLESSLQKHTRAELAETADSSQKDAQDTQEGQIKGVPAAGANEGASKAVKLELDLLDEYRRTVGGYFRRFKPNYFTLPKKDLATPSDGTAPEADPVTLEAVLTYAFLRADLDFITAQARKPDPDDPYVSDFPLNNDEVLGSPHQPPSGHGIGGPARFKGGSTASVALISSPTPAPFWHPASHSSLVVAHVGDTRILLCETKTGLPRPLTSDHHPSSPAESRRLRRFAESLVTDSFGEERIQGLANSRAFGDMQSKRIGVSAEPDITRVDMGPAEFSFLVLMSDGVSGSLSDQEIVDVIKEARTPEEGARHVVEYATEISSNGDNATCLVVRLGGWERRSEGGLGSLGTKEVRDARRAEALDPRRRGRN